MCLPFTFCDPLPLRMSWPFAVKSLSRVELQQAGTGLASKRHRCFVCLSERGSFRNASKEQSRAGWQWTRVVWTLSRNLGIVLIGSHNRLWKCRSTTTNSEWSGYACKMMLCMAVALWQIGRQKHWRFAHLAWRQHDLWLTWANDHSVSVTGERLLRVSVIVVATLERRLRC